METARAQEGLQQQQQQQPPSRIRSQHTTAAAGRRAHAQFVSSFEIWSVFIQQILHNF